MKQLISNWLFGLCFLRDTKEIQLTHWKPVASSTSSNINLLPQHLTGKGQDFVWPESASLSISNASVMICSQVNKFDSELFFETGW
jgi:hypothetical protein